MTTDSLVQVSSDAALFVVGGTPEATAVRAWDWSRADLLVRTVRGDKMRTYEDLNDEFAAAFQFPYYFGENWAAFRECLADMDWLTLGKGIVVVVRHAVEVLADEPNGDLGVLVRAFDYTREQYAEPIERGEAWDRPAVPFHVVLQAEPDDVAALTERWTAAGATLEPLPA